MGYVYIILEIDKDGFEHHKIGVSKNDPEKRLKQLSTGNPNELRVLSKYESIQYKKIEKWLHGKFFNKKTTANNEWFLLSDADVLNFKSECMNADIVMDFMIKNNEFFN